MSILLDSALKEEVQQAWDLGFVSGVTTNPALIAATGQPGLDILIDILQIVDGEVFYQVTGEALSARQEEAKSASALAPDRVVIKIPATTENSAMAGRLVRQNVRCALTAVSHASQALIGREAGVDYVIPYVNRLTGQRGDGIAITKRIAAIVTGSETRLLAASLKTPEEAVQAVLAGADAVTLPFDVLWAMGEHELSQQAIEQFNAAITAAE